MQDWFRELNTYLTVAVDYEHQASPTDSNQEMTVRFTVTNSADPPQPGGRTEIRFDRVALKVGIPPKMKQIDIGTLGAQESNTVEHQCQVPELPDIEYEVSGDISPEAIFHITPTASGPLPGEPGNLPPEAYIRMFKEMNVHGWLNSTIKAFPLPGPDTTLAQLSELATPLNDAIVQIRSAQKRLDRILQFVSKRNQQDREALNIHRNAVGTYLTETIQRIAEIQRTLTSSDARQIASAVEHESERLERSARQMDQATEYLAKQIGTH